jgi:acyl transferase domain-containing protein/NAD(P)H-dependent flavin oxidoreductase YrpB (nitropropane dioxygenase family)
MCPLGSPRAAVPIAGSRAGELGVVSLAFAEDPHDAVGQIERLCELGRGRFGVLVEDDHLLEAALSCAGERLDAVLLGGPAARSVARVRDAGPRAIVVAVSLKEALAAERAGAYAVIAKGQEAGGWIGDSGAFVLSQQLVDALEIPVFVHGGIGLRTVAAAQVCGAAGAVLDSQLLLSRESPAPGELRRVLAGADGSETATVGAELGATFRAYCRPGLDALEGLRRIELELAGEEGGPDRWRAAVREAVGGGGVAALGQDLALAQELARRFGTVAGIIDGLRAAIDDARDTLRREPPLAADNPLARSHGTRYPLVQGPMTRVSDRAEFALAVAQAGALPFLALALMRGEEAASLLARTSQLLGERPWGVGILGFVPAELRAEQLAAVREHRPPFALIAGGRPDQAQELERQGIATYLHAPSPHLLGLYLRDGARRFVFEGRECGGHVGPRTSFVLWDTMLRVLLEELDDAALGECQVLLAGGIHDGRSAAMAAATAAPASARGVRVGALMGTAYLFTDEAVQSGAITRQFQSAAVEADHTALLESGPGHTTRCLPSPFVELFTAERRRLDSAGVDPEQRRMQLEALNIGRLRVAAKGVDRAAQDPTAAADQAALQAAGAGKPELVAVSEHEQWERGMYMIGQVAALRDSVTTIAQLHREVSEGAAECVGSLRSDRARPARAPEPPPPAEVAIIGLGCILPGAQGAENLWANILEKVDAIREVPAERWDWRQMFDPDPAAPDKVYSRWGGFIDPVALDPLALGMPPRSLDSIEPFQLLALLCAQAALHDAGYGHRPFDRERTSVILGAGGGGADTSVGYTVRSALPSLLGGNHPDLQEQLFERLPQWTEDSFAGLLMNVAAGRIANRLDLGGTNYTVDAACASSLAAIGLGARELQGGTSEMVLAGGVDAIQNPFAYLCFAKTHALSPTGRCRPFDASADGIAISEGFATVVLKRLADAERDGDRIYAVIRGVGAASDGRDRSLTAPRPEGQMRALRRAYAQARVSPATVSLVEAHGTGTVAGDGAEVEALSTVFGEHSDERQWCAIGSIKSMIGHTKATAGVAGLVKAALALHHRVLPPTIGVSEPNPKADFPSSPFYVNTEARPWLTGAASHPRRAGVSAFGFGGTDFHVVLEEYEGEFLARQESPLPRWPAELLLWSGTRGELITATEDLSAKLDAGEGVPLDVLAHELAAGMSAAGPDGVTLAVVVESGEDLRAKLARCRELLTSGATSVHEREGIHFAERPLARDGRLAFLFPGQGSQILDMGRELAIAFPPARAQFELADRVLAGRYEGALSSFVFPPPPLQPEERRARQAALTDTHVAQAALGATELAWLDVLQALGIEPQLTAGHSYGEFVALAAAGAIDAAQLLELSEARGRFMKQAAAVQDGTMAAVEASPAQLEQLLEGSGVVVANLNSPRQTVVSGPREHVEAAVARCAELGLTARLLPVACAFHSPLVAAAQQELARVLGEASVAAPRVPVYSNTTGRAHSADPREIVRLLAEHLIRPVDFVAEIESMYEDGARVFLEVGPRSVLSGLVGQILGDREHLAVPVERSGRPALVSMLHCLAALAAEGVRLDPMTLFRGRPASRPDLVPADRASGARSAGWLLDGGRAWPAAEPRPLPQPIHATHPQEQGPMTTSMNGGSAHTSPAPTGELVGAQPSHSPPAQPPPVASLGAAVGAPPAGGDRVADVMAGHQQVMQQFLETQRAVMLGYLGGHTQPLAPLAPARALPPALGIRAAAPAASPHAALEHGPAAVPAALAATAASEVPSSAAVAVPDVEPAVAVNGPEPETPGATASGATMTREDIEARLLAMVSERTGYPAEMLGLDADLEGDLGIDSIKRVEIAGSFTQSLSDGDRGAIDMEELTASRTLRAVIDTIETSLGAGGGERPFEDGAAEEERIGRFVPIPMSAPAIRATVKLAGEGAIVILDDGTGVGERLDGALVADGHDVLRLPAGEHPLGEEEVLALASDLRQRHGVKALVHLAALSDAPPRYGAVDSLLVLARALGEDLDASAAAGGAVVLAATRLGGSFGVRGPDGAEGSAGEAFEPGSFEQGALPGFLKSLAQEWPRVRAKAVDLSTEDPARAVAELMVELNAADGLTEVGYRDGQRVRLGLRPAPIAAPAATEPRGGDPLQEGSVLLVTGGGRGITAHVAQRLASRHRPALVLVGRTPLTEEDPKTAAARGLSELRALLIEDHRDRGEDCKPALIEQECRRILRERELRENLASLRATGAAVEYRTCDVADEQAFGALIDDVYDSHGRIDGVIHGAGLIEDRLVADKTRESLLRVMDAKAGAARTLALRLRPESLRFLVLFGSVSGRFGNRGQSDYAAASEVLAKLGHELDRCWPARVVTIGWGPWRSAGMVSPELERQFLSRGVPLIGLEQGCRLLEQELLGGSKGEAEVVLGAAAGLGANGATSVLDVASGFEPVDAAVTAHDPAAPVGADVGAMPLLLGAHERSGDEGENGRTSRLRLEVELDPRRHRYLNDHRIDGRPVLPFAVAMELMAEAAAAVAGAEQVRGLREIRLFDGVSFEQDRPVRLRVDAAPGEHARELEATISPAALGRPHYRARVQLRATETAAGAGEGPAALENLSPFPMDVAGAYRELLFHGPLFQGILAIEGMDERGARSRLARSIPPESVAGTEGLGWLLDPVMLDSALQVQVIWARLQWDVTLLPAQIGAWRAVAAAGAGARAGLTATAGANGAAPVPVRHELRIRPESGAPLCHADHWFYDSEGRLLATLEDVVGVGTQTLNRLAGARA